MNHVTPTPDEVWERISSSQYFLDNPFLTSLSRVENENEYVTIAVISDTHSKHALFSGFEAPLTMFNSENPINNKSIGNGLITSVSKCSTARYFQHVIRHKNSKVLEKISDVVLKCASLPSDKNDAIEGNNGDVQSKNKQKKKAKNSISCDASTSSMLNKPIPIRKGLIHETHDMAILPIIQLSGNKKSITPPKTWIGLKNDNMRKEHPQSDQIKESSTDKNEYPIIPYADILIHCGDFTMKGSESEVENFIQFMIQLPHPHKIIIAGNHEVSLDENHYKRHDVRKRWKLLSAPDDLPRRNKMLMDGLIYLEDQECTIDIVKDKISSNLNNDRNENNSMKIKLFGSPIQPAHHDWAFQKKHGEEIQNHWKKVLPSNIDILITHCPPLGRADIVPYYKINNTEKDAPLAGSHKGCPYLLWEVQNRIKPKIHVFGHIHEFVDNDNRDSFDGNTMFINAAMAGKHDRLRQDAVVKSICLHSSDLLCTPEH